ncbi:MAG: DHH family phosphoesterase [candidate division WOR-3 bacterium]|nr:DHH family phosphoesterase [candidate division WOR-3 bacterium]
MWPLREVDEPAVAQLAAEAGITNLTARLLWLRGVREADAARRWLEPEISHLHPPELLPDFAPAVARIRRAIDGREGILIWGHDDLDGITSVVILYRMLTDLQAKVRYYIPQKGKEKHGLNGELAAGFGSEGVSLVITVDCGITNRQQVEFLHSRGIDVVVTDHHEVTEPMPDSVANVDPKRPDSKYPYRGLAGAGVALKLAMGVAREVLGLSPDEFISVQPQQFAMAVLGTLADRVPLTGENRTIVTAGLRKLRTIPVPAVRAVFEYLNAGEKLTVHRFVTELLPLFASANGNEGVQKFLTSTADEARTWVVELARRREEWHQQAEQTYELAQEHLSVGDGIVFARSRELSLRALGFCAMRLKDKYQLPAIVMGWRGDAWVGEGRGVEGLSLMDVLSACSRFFIDYGGHKKAAGFSMKDEFVEEFIRCAEAYAHEHFTGRVQPENGVRADAFLPLAEFDPGLVRLAPFGEGNPQPVFATGPTELRFGDDGWTVAGRPGLTLHAADRGIQIDTRLTSRLLYTLDDFGRLTILDAKPVASNE